MASMFENAWGFLIRAHFDDQPLVENWDAAQHLPDRCVDEDLGREIKSLVEWGDRNSVSKSERPSNTERQCFEVPEIVACIRPFRHVECEFICPTESHLQEHSFFTRNMLHQKTLKLHHEPCTTLRCKSAWKELQIVADSLGIPIVADQEPSVMTCVVGVWGLVCLCEGT